MMKVNPGYWTYLKSHLSRRTLTPSTGTISVAKFKRLFSVTNTKTQDARVSFIGYAQETAIQNFGPPLRLLSFL